MKTDKLINTRVKIINGDQFSGYEGVVIDTGKMPNTGGFAYVVLLDIGFDVLIQPAALQPIVRM